MTTIKVEFNIFGANMYFKIWTFIIVYSLLFMVKELILLINIAKFKSFDLKFNQKEHHMWDFM